jgi:hypothetical protein
VVAVTPQRIVVLDAGRSSFKKARGVVTELPQARPGSAGGGTGAGYRRSGRHAQPCGSACTGRTRAGSAVSDSSVMTRRS